MPRNPPALALVPAALALVLAVAVACGADGAARARGSTDTPSTRPVGAPATPAPAGPPAVAVVRAWDDARAVAWARGDARRVAALYTPASVAGRRDVTMLRAWTARGLVVRGLRTQLLSVRELGRTASTWTLLVTDRLAGGVAVGHGQRRPLPRDGASTRTVRLRLLDGRWRVAAVLPGEVVR